MKYIILLLLAILAGCEMDKQDTTRVEYEERGIFDRGREAFPFSATVSDDMGGMTTTALALGLSIDGDMDIKYTVDYEDTETERIYKITIPVGQKFMKEKLPFDWYPVEGE